MMFKAKRIISLLLVFFALILPLGNSVYGFALDEQLPTQNEQKEYSLLLVYDYRNYFADLRDSITTTREMMGHFNVVVEEIQQGSYQAGQLDQYDYVVIMGLQGEFDNVALISDLSKTQSPIIWIGKGIEKLLEKSDEYNIEYLGPLYDFSNVTYNRKTYPIGVKREFSAIKINNSNVEVYSWLHTGADKLPFILKDNNLWYVSRIDLNEPLIFIFSDILFDILPSYIEPYRKVYLRIEDVHPFRDPDKLREIADYLYSKNIPFMIGLIPAHRQPDSRYITEMDEVPDFVEAVKYMQDRGGTIILHGYTHTVFGSDISGEGFEYWDGNEDKPLDRDIDEWVRYTIGRGVRLSIENELYPLGFEAPHYAMSQDAYISLKKYFSTYVGQIQSSDWGFSTSVVPYEVRDTLLFHKLLPESLGYIDPFSGAVLDEIKYNYELINIVRSYMAGVFYHPYLDIDYLKELVEYLESNNAEFYDMREDYHWVKFDEYEIINDYGELYITYPENRRDQRKVLRRFFTTATVVLIGLLILVVYKFIKMFFSSKSVTNNKLKG